MVIVTELTKMINCPCVGVAPVLIGTRAGPGGQVFSAAFNPAGTQLAAANAYGTVFTWDASQPATACANLGQPPTPAVWSAHMLCVPYEAYCG